MKNTFKHYIPYTEEEIKSIWTNAIFIFDTNILLNLYRYNIETSNTFIEVLEQLKTNNSLKMPYHIGVEFHENQHQVIFNNMNFYQNIIDKLNKHKDTIQKDINTYKNHPFANLENIIKNITVAIDAEISEISHLEKMHKQQANVDFITEKLYNIFDGIITTPYSKDKLNSYNKEAEQRFINKIPPGYKDKDKNNNNFAGDYIIWMQLMEIAQNDQKNIIFISEDLKEDWWLKQHGETIMPRVELKKEFHEQTKQNFHIYKPEQFLIYYQQFNNYELDPNALDVVEQISNESQGGNYITKSAIDNFLENCIQYINLILNFHCITHESYEYDLKSLLNLKETFQDLYIRDLSIGKQPTHDELLLSAIDYINIIDKILNNTSFSLNRNEHTKLHEIRTYLDNYIIENNT